MVVRGRLTGRLARDVWFKPPLTPEETRELIATRVGEARAFFGPRQWCEFAIRNWHPHAWTFERERDRSGLSSSIGMLDVVTVEFDWTGWAVPYWMALLASAVLPVAFLASWRRRCRWSRRPVPGLCRTCGYDLRATAERCPECGTVPIPSVPRLQSRHFGQTPWRTTSG